MTDKQGFPYLASMLRTVVLVLLSVICLQGYSQQKNALLKKLSPRLHPLLLAQKKGDSIVVSVSAKSKIYFRFLHQQPSSLPFHFYTGKIATADLSLLAGDKQVLFISEVVQPREEITTGASDPTLNQITFVQHRFPQLRGASVAASIKERLFDTTDIDLKGRVLQTGFEHTNVTAHASLMATIIAGGGNSSPFAIGAAPAAVVSSVSFNNLFPEPDSFFRSRNISVQNHSYGTVVENFYGNEAVAFDQTAFNNPTLLHVFSAGNAGTTTPSLGPYTGVTGMANLTGNVKQAKNILTVSGIDSMGGLLPLSSRGPAYDGRVKPELTAYGEDGSSGAAALTSGVALLIQDRYRQLQGALPSSALTKAVLLNSADDIGEKGVDYLSGYGSLNGYKAVQTISDGRYFQDSVEQGGTKSFRLIVPENSAQLKITLAWNDLPAAPNAAKALVNDLDIVLFSPGGQSWLPWVLDPSPSNNLLLRPAQRKRDSLNNVEQISLENPPAGEYRIDIRGTVLQSVRQSFAVAHETDTTNTFYFTFPTASDHLTAGKGHLLRWQTNITGTGKIAYATAGENWREIGSVDSLSKKFTRWAVPDTVTTARLRLTMGSGVFLSDTFTINQPLALQTGFNCADSFLLYWRTPGAVSYRLFQLGERYLEPLMTTSDTSLILSKTDHPASYYSIAPIIAGKEGLRSHTSNYAAQGVGCYLRSFYLQTQTGTGATFVAEIGTVYNVATITLEASRGAAFMPVQNINPPQSTTFTFSNVPLHPGENRFRLRVQLQNGRVLYSNTETVYSTGENGPVFVYPNPAPQSGELKILTSEVGRYTVVFFDAAGRQVYQSVLNSSVSSLPGSRFAKGLYFIRVIEKDGKARTIRQIIF